MSILTRSKSDPDAKPLVKEKGSNKSVVEKKTRVVHAKVSKNREIVRYGQAWYVEEVNPPGRKNPWDPDPIIKPEKELKKEKTTLLKAAKLVALEIYTNWSPGICNQGIHRTEVYFDRGSKKFDDLVKELCPLVDLKIQQVDLGDGHQKFWSMLCPGCREVLHVSKDQSTGATCIYHAEADGGCGIDGYVAGPLQGYIPVLGKVLYEERKAAIERLKR